MSASTRRVNTPTQRLLATVMCLLVALPLLAGGAAGQQADDLRAEAERISDELDRLSREIGILDEEYNATTLELDDLEEAVAFNEAQVEQARQAVTEIEDELAGYAVDAFIDGGSVGDLSMFLEAEAPNEFDEATVYLDALAGDQQDLVDRLGGAQDELEYELARLDASRADLESHLADLDSTRAEIEGLVGEQTDLLADVEGELEELVRQEQERAAAEEAAQAYAQAQAAAQEEAEQPPPLTESPAAPAPSEPQPAPPTSPDPGGGGGPTAPPPSSGASAAVAAAQSVLGVPYKWAGASPSTGFDCSGLTMWAWAQAGVSLPHSSGAQWSATRRVSIDELQPGDLVFYYSDLHHVGLYVGNGQMIHAPQTGDVVRYASIYRSSLVGAGRP